LASLIAAALTLLALGGPLVASETQPPAGLAQGAAPLDTIPLLTMPPVDNQAQIASARAKSLADAPLQFAVSQATSATPLTHGSWETLADGGQLWRLRIASAGAESINLGFTRYRMPAGGRLSVYDPGYATVLGPYTEQDNEAHGQLWTPIVPGEQVVLEATLPPGAGRGQLDLELTSVGHAFLDPFNPASVLDKSGSCNVDVACSEGAPWLWEIQSVALITIDGSYSCTGALINNTAQDRRPLFLTAEHCDVDAPNAATVVAYWNYESPVCRMPGSEASGESGGGSLSQTLSGAIWRAEYAPSDMSLLELDDAVPASYNPFWAGWDRGAAPPTGAVAIHHPNGDEKRISFENDQTQITSYGFDSSPGSGTHIRVGDWDLGTTEPGSSGSPLFNPRGLIVGQLHGGAAACGNDDPDWYGRLYTSWTGGGTLGTRLSDYLDPLGLGVEALHGFPMEQQYLPGTQR
jgi:hypothetical protein